MKDQGLIARFVDPHPFVCLDIHSQYFGMSCACIHLGVQDHYVSIGVQCESLEMAFQCVANEVSKTPTTKNSTIVIVASKEFIVDHYIQFPLPREEKYLHGASLEVSMVNFSTLASHNFKNYVLGSKQFTQSEMSPMDSIMALKGHFGFKCVLQLISMAV